MPLVSKAAGTHQGVPPQCKQSRLGSLRPSLTPPFHAHLCSSFLVPSSQSSCTPRSPASSRLWCRVSAIAFGWVWGCLCGWVLTEVVQCLHISGLRAQTHVLPLQLPPCRRGHFCVSTAFTAPRRQRLVAPIVRPCRRRNPIVFSSPSLSSLISAAPLSLPRCTCNAAAYEAELLHTARAATF